MIKPEVLKIITDHLTYIKNVGYEKEIYLIYDTLLTMLKITDSELRPILRELQTEGKIMIERRMLDFSGAFTPKENRSYFVIKLVEKDIVFEK